MTQEVIKQITPEFWREKRVVVTGGSGFVGRRVVGELQNQGVSEIVIPRSNEHDLRIPEVSRTLFREGDIIIHLAADVGGIGYNKANPYTLFDNNLRIGINALNAALEVGVGKFVGVGTICEYPKVTTVPFREQDLWDGYPEETNAPYGLAKKMLLVGAQAARDQYGLNAIHVMPVNLYGAGDNFNPKSAHVIPDMIRKFTHAKASGLDQVELFGSGLPTREFMHVSDAARGILLAAEYYNKKDPVNLGSGKEISIKDLAELISKLVGYDGQIVWDTSKPDGQPRRQLDTSRAVLEFGFRAEVSFEKGLEEEVQYYLKRYLNS